MKIFAEIIKRDDEKRLVYGYASTEALDSQGEVVTKGAIEDALPEYMRFANIREMHQLSAVGVTKSAEIDETGLYIEVKVVDDIAWNKVKEGVYKGFSIGGKSLEKTDGVISKMRLTEISLVDRPSNPEAVFEMFKADDVSPEQKAAVAELAKMLNAGDITPAQLVDMAKAAQAVKDAAGAALPDGSFRIEKAEQIKAALLSFPLAKDKAATREHIIKRAQALSAADSLPPRWAAAGDIQKGLHQVSWLAGMLDGIACLQRENAFEQEYEGDTSSTAPAALAGWLESGLKILASMVTEESAELMGAVRAKDEVEVVIIEAAAGAGDILKAGQKFSKDSKDKLAAAHGHVKKAAEHMAKAKGAPMGEAADHMDKCDKCIGKADGAMESLGYAAKDKDEAEKVAAVAPVLTDDAIAKANAPLIEKIAGQDTTIADLLKRLKTLEDQPLPPKGVTRVIGKVADSGGEEPADPTAILASATPADIAKAQIIKLHRAGGTRIA